jgi:four helix bundle protein
MGHGTWDTGTGRIDDAPMTPVGHLHRMTNPPIPRPVVNDLKDLVAWQIAMNFAEGVYKATRSFPDDEIFGLRLQLRRSAVSVASNIAEGHGRISKRDYARFVLIARGSLKEAETQLLLAVRLGFIDAAQSTELLAMVLHVNRLLTGLKKKLRA